VLFQILIDRNDDGQPDAMLVNSNVERYLTSRTDNDAYVAVFYDFVSGARSIAGPLNGLDPAALNTLPLFNSNMVMRIKATALGLSAENSGFNYKVVTASSDLFYREAMQVDETPDLHFDLHAQPYFLAGNVPGALIQQYGGSGPFVLRAGLSLTAFLASQPPLLLLHHRGAPDYAAATPVTRYLWPHQLQLPIVAR
jgi:hypothetical protein